MNDLSDSPTRSLLVLPPTNDNDITVTIEQSEDAVGVSIQAAKGDLIDYNGNRDPDAFLENSSGTKGDKFTLSREGGSTTWTKAPVDGSSGTWGMEAS